MEQFYQNKIQFRLFVFLSIAVIIVLFYKNNKNIFQQKDNQVTVTATVKDSLTGQTPAGLIQITEIKQSPSSNNTPPNYTLTDKNGLFNITITQGSSLSIKQRFSDQTTLINKIEQPLKDSIVYLMPSTLKLWPNQLERNISIDQLIEIEGIVYDQHTKEPLINATVIDYYILDQKGYNKKTMTDENGKFTIQINKNGTIGIGAKNHKWKFISNLNKKEADLKVHLQTL